MTLRIDRTFFVVLFAVSGFAGLIYESIWSHYLKLFLGHAAYAQTLVLAIFMGGMALGAWVCGHYSGRWRNLLLGYALAEAVIGACALAFHRVFDASTGFAYDVVMPALGSPLSVNAFKWMFASALILPQSVLLGMTFPLMTAGVIRAFPSGSGSTIAMLYFSNSLGAAIGVLASGFVLIGLVGLPGTMLTAGLINILLAVVVWVIAKDMPFTTPVQPRAESGTARPRNVNYGLMLGVALLSSAASFMYEIGWIRMLSMVLGSSTHAFELMLSAFILGLALGGLWIRRRIDHIAVPERYLGVVQIAMGVLALATLLVYGHTFEVMRWLMEALSRTEPGYVLFNFGSHLIALAVMLPVAFCAGMTLPLITHALMRRGIGERAIGSVYAANTVGAIIGVFAAVHLGLPHLGLKGTIVFGAAVDIALGLLLIWRVAPRRGVFPAAATAASLAIVAATLAWVELDAYKMASGVYRHGVLMSRDKTEILYHRDGKTATVDLVRFEDRLSIRTNGKSDAAISFKDGTVAVDESTMVLTAALPLAFHPGARTAANIGFGSGLTSHVLLASGRLQSLDSIEIEPAMVEAARGFGERVANVFRDPRSRIHIEDAKTYFSTHNKRYDVIVSEPSNPWVSGVASLFGEQFYRRIKGHLTEGGLLVQWMQLYEITPPLVASVFKALAAHFSDYAIYAANDTDLVIVARKDGRLPEPSSWIFEEPRLALELARIRVRNLADLELHRIGGRKALQPYFDSFRIAPNSDYFPVLDLNAAKARFMQQRAVDVVDIAMTPVPAVEMLDKHRRGGAITLEPRPWLQKAESTRAAHDLGAYLLEGSARRLEAVRPGLRADAQRVRLVAIECAGTDGLGVDAVFSLAHAMAPFLTSEEARPVWAKIRESQCARRHSDAVRPWLDLLAAVSDRDAERMAKLAELLLRRNDPHDTQRLDYLLAAATVGHLAGDRRDAAESLWREFAPKVVSARHNMLPDLLLGHLFSLPAPPVKPEVRLDPR